MSELRAAQQRMDDMSLKDRKTGASARKEEGRG